jgi:hypothetical protein
METITDKYKDLNHYHSGGGCVHLMLESSVDEYKLQWLINPLEDNCEDEPSQNAEYFQIRAPVKDGYMIMKDIDNRLTNAPTWKDC